jgi:nicotinate-nucleotide adenylyltransferase
MNRLDRELPPAPAKSHGLRVAFFGGSFDPPHLGHLAVARAAQTAFHLDTVLFAPVGAQPLKPEGHAAGFEDRVAMTQLAIANEPGFAVSLADAPKPDGQPNFTLETLQQVHAQLGSQCVLFCLMGADSYFGLSRWHRAAEIPFEAPLIVAFRPGESLDSLQDALPKGLTLTSVPDAPQSNSNVEVRKFLIANRAEENAPFYVLPDLYVEISGTEIRRQIREGSYESQTNSSALPTVLPEAVAEYIRARGLYS